MLCMHIYIYICNTTHTWIHLNLSMYGMCGCGWHNHPGTKCVKLCTGIEECICIYSFHLDAHSIRTKICMVYCQHAVGGTNHRALSSFYPHSSCMVGGLDGFWALLMIYPRHCGWLQPHCLSTISPIQHITMIITMIIATIISMMLPWCCHQSCHDHPWPSMTIKGGLLWTAMDCFTTSVPQKSSYIDPGPPPADSWSSTFPSTFPSWCPTAAYSCKKWVNPGAAKRVEEVKSSPFCLNQQTDSSHARLWGGWSSGKSKARLGLKKASIDSPHLQVDQPQVADSVGSSLRHLLETGRPDGVCVTISMQSSSPTWPWRSVPVAFPSFPVPGLPGFRTPSPWLRATSSAWSSATEILFGMQLLQPTGFFCFGQSSARICSKKQ